MKWKSFFILFLLILFVVVWKYLFVKNQKDILLGDITMVYGDVNNDSKVSSLDYIMIRKHLLQMEILNGEQLVRADVNGDSKVSSLDYIIIRKILLGQYIDVDDITLNKTSETLNVGKTSLLIATVSPSNATNKEITWISSDNKIASVSSNGLVTAKSEGVATIQAFIGNVKANYVVTVEAKTTTEYCDSIYNSEIGKVDYLLFKNKFPNSDDYYAIKAAHECANKYNLPVIVTNGEYNIYKKTLGSIVVKTNTNLNNSTIYIHDETDIVGTKSEHIFNISSDNCTTKTMNLTIQNEYETISELSGSLNGQYVRITDSSRKVFIRSGSNQDSGYDVMDSFRVDKDGKILDQLFWKYDNKSVTAYMCDIPSNTLTFENANFYTIVDTNTSNSVKSSSDSVYLRRGILVGRSNVSLANINHSYINSSKERVNNLNHGYYGFFNVNNAANVTFNNLRVHATKNNNSNVNSTYDIILDNAANIKINNTYMIDYDGNDSYFSKSSNQLKDDLWGVTASNNVKNVTYDGCVLNRIDTHRGVYNETIKNTIIGTKGINAIGMGTLSIDNVDMYYRNNFVNLRSDYGSLWKGRIKINNSRIHPNNNDSLYLVDFKLSYDDNYISNFGYDLYLPNIEVDNFSVDSSVNSLYVFNNSESNTGMVHGNLANVKNYIKNNEFTYYYPKKSNITLTNIKNKSSSIVTQNYLIDFGEN